MKKLIDTIEYEGFRFQDSAYEYRLTAFIDLLGFQSFSNKHGLKEVLKSLRIFYKEAGKASFYQNLLGQEYDPELKPNLRISHNTNPSNIEAAKKQDFKVTIFSDLIVLSYRSSKEYIEWNFKELLERVYYAQRYLMHRGLLIRGGITYDHLYHTNTYCVGPALVRAYEIESEEAIYPRVVLDPELLRFPIFKHWAKESHYLFYDQKESLWATDLFSGIRLLCSNDYSEVSRAGLIQTRENVYYDMICLAEIIQEGLDSEQFNTITKAKWIAIRFNDTLDLVKNTISLDATDVCPEVKMNFVKLKIFSIK